MYVCKKNNLKLVGRLLNMGANPSIANNVSKCSLCIEAVAFNIFLIQDGETPVMIAKALGQEQIAQVIMEKSVSQYLNSIHIYLDLESI